MADKKNPHAEHRERVRKEFLAHGFNDATPPHKILEMLLFFSIPRKDTNETAHRLLDRFGSLTALIEAPAEEIVKVEGAGENTAALLKLMIPVIREYSKLRSSKGTEQVVDFNTVYQYLESSYIGYTNEVFAITSFNHRGTLAGFDILAEGSNSEVKISIRQIIEALLRRNAAYAIISHNHPGGVALPSPSDIDMTQRIGEALKSIGVPLVDHVILAGNDFVSLRQSQAYSYLFK